MIGDISHECLVDDGPSVLLMDCTDSGAIPSSLTTASRPYLIYIEWYVLLLSLRKSARHLYLSIFLTSHHIDRAVS